MKKASSLLPHVANLTTRRQVLKGLGLSALGLVSLNSLTPRAKAANTGPLSTSEINIVQFLLNLEYLEAQYFTFASTGANIQSQGVAVTGLGTFGGVMIKGGPQVPFADGNLAEYAAEIAGNERAHVEYLRSVLGSLVVAQPALDLELAFDTMAVEAGIITAGETFDPFADDTSFKIGAMYFEDVVVTAYREMIPLVSDSVLKSALAGLLGAEGYHAAIIRTKIFEEGATAQTEAADISNLRDRLDGDGDDDQGVVLNGNANIVPVNSVGMTFTRTTRQVLNIFYLKANAVTGGFFPNGINF
jgi:Ferritin-like domain